MLIILPLLLVILGLMYGSSTAHYIGFEVYLKDLRNLFYRLGVSFEPLEDYRFEGRTYGVSQLVMGLLLFNICFTFYTLKDDITIDSSTPTI